MTVPLDLDAIQARADAATGGTWRYESYAGLGPNGVLGAVSIPIGRFDFGDGDQADADRAFVLNAHQDVTALLTEIRRLRAELEQYTALELAYTDGRISATCDNSRHPTWLRSPDDTRGCPWCELDQARQRNAAVLALLPDDPADDINAPFVPLRRIRAAANGETAPASAVATVCDAPHPIVEWSRCGRTPDHEGFHAADCGTWPRSRFPFGSSPS